jgi:hypothetical protein
MSEENINLTAPIHAATQQGKAVAAREVFMDGDKETVQQIGEKTHQLEDAIKDITVSGGASIATAVSYNNETSGMTAITAQGAIDELAAKNKAQDTTIGTKAEKSEVATELDKKFDKENIAQEFGESKDKVVSQFALPFREIESPEFIKTIVDAEDHFLFGIQLDGSIEWGKGIPAPIKAKLQEIVNQCQQDKTDVLEAINAVKEELSANITALQEGKVDKEEGKSLIEDEVKECFRVIENEEFIKAVVDSDDRVLYGIYRDTGKPYLPQNDMYHISQSEEFLWVILDAANHPLLGILQDGTCWAAKAQWLDDIKAIKEALSSIDEILKTFQLKEDGKGLINLDVANSFFYISNDEYIIAVVDAEDRVLAGIKYDAQPYFPNHEMYSVITNEEWLYAIIDAEDKVLGGFSADDGHMIVGGIDISTFIANAIVDVADIKERTTHLSTINNNEYLAVETDSEGKVIGYITPDGSHYLYKVKSETIPEEFEHIEDPEGRTEITTDADGKTMSYRDANGVKNELAGFNSSQYYQNNVKKEWIEEKNVLPIVKKSDGDIPLNIMGGITDHNTINLLVPSEIQKTFSDGVNSFSPPNAGYELSNRIECKAGDWFSRTGTATGMIIVTDANDKNGKRLFNSDGSTLGSTFQIPDNLTDVKYIRMAVDAEAAKAGNVAICKGKNAFEGEQKGDFLTIDKLRVTSSNMPKDLKFIKTSNGDYYELYIDESDFSVKARKIDPSVITELPDDFPVFNCSGDFTTYFNSWVAMVDNKYLVERNQNGVTNYLKLGANAYGYAEFRKETTSGGIHRYVAMFPYGSYAGLKGEKGLTIYDKDFNVIDTNIKVNNTPDAHDFIYFDDNHLIVCSYINRTNITINHSSGSFTSPTYRICIQEIKKINGTWKEIASFDTNDYPLLLTDGIYTKSPLIMLHWNTIQLDYDGNLIVNMRDMNCFWKIKRTVDSEGNVVIGSKTKDYNEAVIGRVGGTYNSAYIDSKRVLEEGFRFIDVPSSLTDISSDEIPLWKFYHEHDVTYWGKKEIEGKEYPTYTLFDNNMWTGETPTANYYDKNPRNNYENNPKGNNDLCFINSKSDGGTYDERMVSRVVQLSIDWDNHLIKDYKVYEIPKKYSYTRSSVQMFDEGVLFISWADQNFCGVFDFNDQQTVVDGKLYKNGKMLFSSRKASYRVHGYK